MRSLQRRSMAGSSVGARPPRRVQLLCSCFAWCVVHAHPPGARGKEVCVRVDSGAECMTIVVVVHLCRIWEAAQGSTTRSVSVGDWVFGSWERPELLKMRATERCRSLAEC